VELAGAPEVVADLVPDVLLGLVFRLALDAGTHAGLLVLAGVVLLVSAGVVASARARRRAAAAPGPGAEAPVP
ncbi:MAG: peptidase S8, partial [Firmicutes bacterium]|nr:peptidase S8 [Bacillota bacterium]